MQNIFLLYAFFHHCLTVCDGKYVKTPKNLISTSEQRSKHPCAGHNTQQLILDNVVKSSSCNIVTVLESNNVWLGLQLLIALFSHGLSWSAHAKIFGSIATTPPPSYIWIMGIWTNLVFRANHFSELIQNLGSFEERHIVLFTYQWHMTITSCTLC